MNAYLLLKISHSLPAVLLLLGVLAHTFMLFKAQRSGDVAVLQRKLRVTRRYSLPALFVLALSLPVSGWLLVDYAGWPLSQLWLLLSTALYGLLLLFGLLLAGRLAAWQNLSGSPAADRPRLLCALYALGSLLLLLAISALMGAKPM